MSPDAFSTDMLEFLRLMDAHGVRYLLIGGYAVTYYGHVRFTADIDFAYSPDAENCGRLYSALLEFWGGQIPHVASPDELTRVGMVFQFGVKPNRIDLLSRVEGLAFDEAWARRNVVLIEGPGLPISIISLQDLRRTKAAAGRLKDLDDLENLPTE